MRPFKRKCEMAIEIQHLRELNSELLVNLNSLCDVWVNGRSVIEGIPMRLRESIESVLAKAKKLE